MSSFVLSKTVLALDTFSGMIAYPIAKQQDKPQGKIVDVDPPDPTGKRTGRKRDQWRVQTQSGTYYSPTKPEGVPDPKGEEGAPSDKPVAEPEKPVAPPKPQIFSDIQEVNSDVKNEKVSLDQAKDTAAKLLVTVSEKLQQMASEMGASHHAGPMLESIKGKWVEAAQGVKDSHKKDDRKGMSQALESLQAVAGDVDAISQILESGKKFEERGEKPETKPAEVKAGKEFVYEKGALSTAPWEGKIDQIESSITGRAEDRKKLAGVSMSAVYFDTAKDGTVGVFKPEGMGVPHDFVRPDASLFDPHVTSTDREVSAFGLDRALGFGVVPPTFVKKTSEISKKEKRDNFKQVLKDAKRVAKASGATLDEGQLQFLIDTAKAPEVSGSVQAHVGAATPGGIYAGLEDAAKTDQKLRFNLEKLAVFDFLTGASDRHGGNFMVDPNSKEVYAIDNGLNFPKTPKGVPEEHGLMSVTSQPMHMINNLTGGEIDEKIVDQLSKVDTNKVREVLQENGMNKEVDGVLTRLNYIKENGKLPDNLLNMYTEHVKERSAKKQRAQQETMQVNASFDNLSCLILKENATSVVDVWMVDPNKKIITFKFDGNKVKITRGGELPLAQYIEDVGVIGFGGERFKMEDGEKFMLNLPLAIGGSGVRAIERK